MSGPTSARIQSAPVAYYHIVTDKGQELGWVGFCEQFDEAMIDTLMHAGGEDGAKARAADDPPTPLSSHNGKTFVPFSWIVKCLPDESYLPAVKAMESAARKAYMETKKTPQAFTDQIRNFLRKQRKQ